MTESLGRRATYNSTVRREQADLTKARILDAAARLFVDRGYPHVTIADIATEARVAYQTVFSVFGTKVGVAKGVIWTSFQFLGIDDLIAEAAGEQDLEAAIRTGARITRRLNERLAPLLRFMRESGDEALLAEFRRVEARRLEQIRDQLQGKLKQTARLRQGLTPAAGVDIVWALCGTDLYTSLVSERQWSASRYEAWLGDALVAGLLVP